MDEIRSLSVDERKALITAIVDTLVPTPESSLHRPHPLRELRGLGKEIWQGIDVQAYIDEQRDEWDKRS